MKILIDVAGCISDSSTRGIGRYAREFISRAVKKDTTRDIHLLINYVDSAAAKKFLRDFRALVEPEKIHFWSSSCQSGDPFDNSSEEYKIAEAIYKASILEVRPDMVVFTEPFHYQISVTDLSEYGITSYAFVYDLIPALFPQDYLSDGRHRQWYQDRMKLMLDMSTILTISESSRNDIYDKIGHDDILNIGCDTTSDIHQLTGEYDQINGIAVRESPFILYTGGFDYRKNIDFLIRAFSEFIRQGFADYKLYIVGRSPDPEKARLLNLCRKLGCARSVEFLGYISDSQLSFLYRHCQVFVNPSSYEGFGLPVLEAMRCSAPVLVADNSNLAELVSSEAGKFRTKDEYDFITKLTKICRDENLQSSLIEQGVRDAKKYDWDRIMDSFFSALDRLQGSGSSLFPSSSPLRDFIEWMGSRDLSDAQCLDIAKALNKSEDLFAKKPAIYLDISILIHVDSGTGIQRVVRALSYELINNYQADYDVLPVYFCHRRNGFVVASFEYDEEGGIVSFGTQESVAPTDFRQRDIFLGLDLNHNWVVNHNRQFNRIINSPARFYFIVYDLLPVKHPDLFDPVHNLPELHSRWLIEISKSDGILAISQTVSAQYAEYIENQIKEKQPHYFLNSFFRLGSDIESGVPDSGTDQAKSKLDFLDDSRVTLLMVGTLEPRKGHEAVLDALELIWKQGKFKPTLVLAGKLGWNMQSFARRIRNHPEHNISLYWLDSLTDLELKQLYAASNGVLAASIDEGFGLPIVEAATNGTPVLARDIPVFREVGGDGVCYFPAHANAEELAGAISDWIDDLLRDRVPDPGRVESISWRESAAQLFELVTGRETASSFTPTPDRVAGRS